MLALVIWPTNTKNVDYSQSPAKKAKGGHQMIVVQTRNQMAKILKPSTVHKPVRIQQIMDLAAPDYHTLNLPDQDIWNLDWFWITSSVPRLIQEAKMMLKFIHF